MSRPVRRRNWVAVVSTHGCMCMLFLIFSFAGCGGFCGQAKTNMIVVGQLVASEPPAFTAYGTITVRTYNEGVDEDTGHGNSKGDLSEAPDEDGHFRIAVWSRDSGQVCDGRIIREAEFPPPDRLTVVVPRDGCGPAYIEIELNEATVVDPSVPDGVIELTEPIVVPCAVRLKRQ